MSVEVFVDTNLLYYAFTQTPDPRHALARECVRGLWETGRAAVSVQVLQELHVNLVRKAGFTVTDSAARVQTLLAWKVVDNDKTLLKAAFDAQQRWQLSFWDSLIVAAAQRSGARELWSEDLSHGQHYGDTQVLNPLITPQSV